ncbi:MAG: hypothetical protein AWU57_352 [Marinobacter sp. T13-3]|nr:MAG: hypothetical protein AWU57_352 [Marinobacter sp. T13-3]
MELNTSTLTPLQRQMAERLKVSTLTPGFYQPSASVREGIHRVVMAGDTPVLAVGPDNCPYSEKQAEALAKSPKLAKALRTMGFEGDLSATTKKGADLGLPDTCAAMIVKPTGEVVEGTSLDKQQVHQMNSFVTLPPEKGQTLAALICTDNELLHILDPWAPALPTSGA